MITTAALPAPTTSAPAAGASAVTKAAGATDAVGQTTFATVLAEATAEGTATPQASTTPTSATNAATVVAQLAGAGTDAATPATEEEVQATDVAGTPDPAAILAGTTTQQTAQVTLAIPAIPVAIAPVMNASAEGVTTVEGETPEAGAVIPAIGAAGAAVQTAAGAATTSASATAQAAAIAQPAAATTPAQPTTPIDAADAESADASAATSSSANGQAPAKAAAAGTQTPSTQGAPANAAANATPAAGAQVEVAVEAASTLQSKAGAATEIAASTTAAPQNTSNTASASQVAQTAAPAATLQVYTRFVERFDGRAQRFEVRLDPAELGRVDVRIEIGADKKVHAVLAAHDSAALNDLMRGHRALERMLTNAGIDLADGGVKFEMASDSGRDTMPGKSDSGPSSPNVWRRFDTLAIPLEASATASPQPWRRTRLDLVA